MTNHRQPAVFFGHGSPMNTLQQNRHTDAWAAFGRQTLQHPPAAVLCISAHWYIHGTAVTATATPPTIHDFGGFPKALYEVEYAAPGSPELAQRIVELLSPLAVALDRKRGLDHGAWSVLARVFPKAEIPVVQLSIDASMPPEFHYELGQKLAVLRDEGVLIMGSGNTVHNLRTVNWDPDAPAYDWALRFDERVRDCLVNGDYNALIDYERLTPDAKLAVPTPDHYLPLLYILGARRPGDDLQFITEGIELGSISMLAFAFS
ncbi:4,5-DOPA-extradiol-dioxygenase [Methylocaldum szegediense]|uniref:4,5-DOPA dioxygenase extradiol n=1 Tax=Methylocaldum szegediense TaxID=73780 RepID=A0ABN8X3G4_9GAMM|nr:4,5-DOPA dioxygenase extradiol [Methylocaldum szegediense]CAI8753752.1 4,5-DOPA dioxygenase extradiol [Methylocaldum szegediense]